MDNSVCFLRVYAGRTRPDVILVDRGLMVSMKLLPGDVVVVIGERQVPFYVQENRDEKGGIVVNEDRLKLLRVREGEKVAVRKVEAVELKEVTLAPSVQKQYDLRKLNVELRGKLASRGITLETRDGDFLVTSMSPQVEVGRISSATAITLAPESLKIAKLNVPYVTLDQVGGLDRQLKELMNIVEIALVRPEVLRPLGLRPPKGVLLYGPPGTGKTLIAKALANAAMANFFYISGPEIGSKYYGESEKRLREIFEQAEKNAPSIIFIDEIDAITPNRDLTTSEADRRIVAQLLTLMDGLSSGDGVLVIGATNRINAVDPALRRPGRFDREIEIPVPDRNGRLEILKIHCRMLPLDPSVNLEYLADVTIGFTGADLEALVREATMKAFNRAKGDLNSLKITQEDLLQALKSVEPSALREFRMEIPNTSWDDIVGLDEVKVELKEVVEWPLTKPELYEQMKVELPTGILLYGPPGTGKTMLARAVAHESKANFIVVNGPELMSMWAGETERQVREVFRRARQVAPSIVFFDEIDSMTMVRGSDPNRLTDRVVSQLLTEMDGISKRKEKVIVIAATNRPDIIDPALLRPGRFDKLIYVPPPDERGRAALLARLLERVPHEVMDVNRLVKLTENFTPAEIKGVVNKAVLISIRRAITTNGSPKLAMEDLLEALKYVKPSVNKAMLSYYERFRENAARGFSYA